MRSLRPEWAILRTVGRPMLVSGLAAASLGTALTLLLGGDAVSPPTGGIPAIDRFVQWLHLPLFLIGSSILVAVVETWPGFGRARPGRGLLDRLRPGALDGCVAAMFGACAIQALLAALVVLVVGVVTDAGAATDAGGSTGPESSAVLEVLPLTAVRDPQSAGDAADLRAPGSEWRDQLIPALGPGRPRLRFALPDDPRLDRIRLRPRPLITPAGFAPARLRVRFEGTDAESAPTDFSIARNGVVLDLRRPRESQQLLLERLPGSQLALVFEDGAAVATRRIERSRTLNTVFAASLSAVSLFVALAGATVVRRSLRTSLCAAVAVALFALVSLGALAPQVPALAEAARGRDALGPATRGVVFWSLSLGTALTLGAAGPSLARRHWLRRAT